MVKIQKIHEPTKYYIPLCQKFLSAPHLRIGYISENRYGECPKNRFARTADGEPGLNCLCAGYRQYFGHVAPYVDFMANELKHRRAPANVMSHIDDIH